MNSVKVRGAATYIEREREEEDGQPDTLHIVRWSAAVKTRC